MRLRQVIFDFDGTSTLVEPVQEAFLAEYRRLLVEGVSQSFADAWDDALQQLAKASPEAAWSTLSTVPAAPAYADPYIAASESVGSTRGWKLPRGLSASGTSGGSERGP